jgi:hypothetical protein
MCFTVAKCSELIRSHKSILQFTKRDDKNKNKKSPGILIWATKNIQLRISVHFASTSMLTPRSHLQLNHNSFLLYIYSICTLTCTCQLVLLTYSYWRYSELSLCLIPWFYFQSGMSLWKRGMIPEAVCKRILTAEVKINRSAVGPGFVIVKSELG